MARIMTLSCAALLDDHTTTTITTTTNNNTANNTNSNTTTRHHHHEEDPYYHPRRRDIRQWIAMIKVVVPQLTYRIVDRAVQIHGGAGACEDTVLAHFLVALRTLRIADGPDAVHKQSIARMELKKVAASRL